MQQSEQLSKKFNDHFSIQSAEYSKYRPKYPDSLFNYLSKLTKENELAWDAACGNGQAALGLANYFDRVIATDGSASMIENAISHPKIDYRVALAEDPGLDSKTADIVTVATAIHWLDTDRFYLEVRRILKPGGIIAVWIYNSIIVNAEIDKLMKYFSEGIVDKYWPADAKKLFEDSVDFPFERITTPEFSIENEWTAGDFMNFLITWSSVQKFMEAEKTNPIDIIKPELMSLWGKEKKKILWPLKMKVGRV